MDELNVPNIDGIEDDSELAELERALCNLATYVNNKRAALSLRIAGNIPAALAHERKCDQVYKKLPETARW